MTRMRNHAAQRRPAFSILKRLLVLSAPISTIHFKAMPTKALLILGISLLTGCTGQDGEVREWTAADHDQPKESQAQSPKAQTRPSDADEKASLIELAWQKNCLQCHGPTGRGDGPQGPMVRAPDLTRDEWQQRVSDQEMADVILKGRNKMPKFDLSDSIVQGLVQRIRSARKAP